MFKQNQINSQNEYDYGKLEEENKEETELFSLSKSLGENVIKQEQVIKKVKGYIKSFFTSLKDEDISLSFYKPEKVIIGIVPNDTHKST
jgi:hypothetical protein